jgi:hypothetical protein
MNKTIPSGYKKKDELPLVIVGDSREGLHAISPVEKKGNSTEYNGERHTLKNRWKYFIQKSLESEIRSKIDH